MREARFPKLRHGQTGFLLKNLENPIVFMTIAEVMPWLLLRLAYQILH